MSESSEKQTDPTAPAIIGTQGETYAIAVIHGDGIGVDVTDAALAVTAAACERIGGFRLRTQPLVAGARYYAETGKDIAPGAEEEAEKAEAILLGAIGWPDIRWPDGTEIAPHLRLRERLQLYAGVRPVKTYPNTPRRLVDPRAGEIDLIVLRECTEGLFYSAATHHRGTTVSDDEVRETLSITRRTSEKLHDFAFRLAEKRRLRGGKGKVTCVDKANVFHSMAFFRRIFDERAAEFPTIGKDHRYIDAMAFDMIRKPWEYDVLVMENMFGDILSDLGAGLVGGLGMASCAEIGDEHGLFQPAHGTAPDIAGQDRANPIAAILSAAMMLDYLGDKAGDPRPSEAGQLIERSVECAFSDGRLRSTEFGGEMGTRAIARELVDVISTVK
jgi:3-isopropylmalate dehydrogenase